MSLWKSPLRNKILAAFIVVAIGGTVGFKKYQAAHKPDAPTNEAKVEKGDIELHFVDSGELTPKTYIDVASKVSGRVIEMPVEEGSRVKEGDKLSVIQPGKTEAEQYVPTTVKSPMNGVVMRYQDRSANNPAEGRIVKIGDYVTGLMDSTAPSYLLTVADLSKLVVKMKISEMDVLKLREGMPVKVTIDALPGQDYPAKVTLVSPQAEKDQNNLKSFKVEVSLLRSDARLKPGMTARVDGLLDARKKVLKMPLAAVFEETGKEYAYFSKTDKRELKLGLRSEMEAEVLSGVKEGDKPLTEKPSDKPTP
jgi:HlyD family secretion protein